MSVRRRDFLSATGLIASAPLILSAGQDDPAGNASPLLTLGNSDAALTVHSENGQPLRLRSLRNRRSMFEWCRQDRPVEPLFVAKSVQDPRWTLKSAKVSAPTMDLVYGEARGVVAHSVLTSFTDAPVFDLRCDFQNSGPRTVEGVSAFGPLRIALRPDLGPLQVHAVRRNKYALERLPVRGRLEISGGIWNKPAHAGLIILEAMEAREFLFIGIEWERGWRYRLDQTGRETWLSVEVTDLHHDLRPGSSLQSPAVFLGLCAGGLDTAVNAAHRYLKAHVFPKPQPHAPWIAYDFWGTEKEGVEEVLLKEIDFAADLGVELFYLDASWYKGSSKRGTGDWGCGLGNYTEDWEKYPHGLAYINDRIHARGMKSGLWVAPNIVDSRLIPDVIPRHWLAQVDGRDRIQEISSWEATCHQVCLGCREYIEHLKENLGRIVRDYHLDWLKWDNSGIPGNGLLCDRADHGHQRGDGSYAAVLGEYEIFRHLHTQFPDLVLEQCGYGSRLDYGLARMIRNNWLSDAMFPSAAVRRNAFTGAFVYPSFYNGTWLHGRDQAIKETTDPALIDTLFRSRMIGSFGFGMGGKISRRVSLFPPEVLAAARRNFALYKKYRHLLHDQVHFLLPPAGSPEQWQAIEFVRRDASQAVVLCFRGSSTQDLMRVTLRGLRKHQRYKITSANTGETLHASGDRLLREGLIASLPKPEMSEVFLLEKEA